MLSENITSLLQITGIVAVASVLIAGTFADLFQKDPVVDANTGRTITETGSKVTIYATKYVGFFASTTRALALSVATLHAAAYTCLAFVICRAVWFQDELMATEYATYFAMIVAGTVAAVSWMAFCAVFARWRYMNYMNHTS